MVPSQSPLTYGDREVIGGVYAAVRDRPEVFVVQGQEVVPTFSGGVRLVLKAYAFACLDLP